MIKKPPVRGQGRIQIPQGKLGEKEIRMIVRDTNAALADIQRKLNGT